MTCSRASCTSCLFAPENIDRPPARRKGMEAHALSLEAPKRDVWQKKWFCCLTSGLLRLWSPFCHRFLPRLSVEYPASLIVKRPNLLDKQHKRPCTQCWRPLALENLRHHWRIIPIDQSRCRSGHALLALGLVGMDGDIKIRRVQAQRQKHKDQKHKETPFRATSNSDLNISYNLAGFVRIPQFPALGFATASLSKPLSRSTTPPQPIARASPVAHLSREATRRPEWGKSG